MFLFKSKKQVKQPKVEVDPKIQLLQHLFKPQGNNTIINKSQIKQFYEQISKSIPNNEQFLNKYQKQILRIKKSQGTWNYSDMRVVRLCIQRSIEQQSLSFIFQKWCQTIKISIKHYQQNQSQDISNNHQKINIRQFLKTEMLILCTVSFRFAFQINQVFFLKHYSQKSKIGLSGSLKKQQIYLKQQQIFEDFIRNCLTRFAPFSLLFNQVIIKSIIPHRLHKQQQMNPQIKQQFQHFIKKQLKIATDLTQIYCKTSLAIKQFHKESNLQTKILKACSITQSIQRDHQLIYKKNGQKIQHKTQTISTQILNYLFKLYCPEIQSSISYLKMAICYRFEESDEQNEFETKLDQFCHIWLSQDINAHFHIILDVFQGI